MSIWSDLFSKKEESANKPEVSKEQTLAPSDKGTQSEKREVMSSVIDYDQFVKQPGNSISFLNNDPNWNKFVLYESDHEEELVARFKRQDFENYFLNSAYKKGIINFRTIENRGVYEINISVNEIITTYQNWANKNEPIICINARILNTTIRPGLNRCVFEYRYLVRAPFAGYLESSSFYQERETNGGRIYKLYTAQRTKEVWPRMLTDFIHDDLDRLPRVCMHFNEYIYDEHFSDDFPFWDWEAEGKLPCLRYEWKTQNYASVIKGQHICSIIKNPYGNSRKEYKIFSPVSGFISIDRNYDKTEYKYQQEMNISELFTIYKDKHTLIYWKYLLGFDEIKEVDNFEGTLSLSWEKVAGRELPPNEDEIWTEGYKGFEMVADSGRYMIVSLQIKSNIPYIVFSFNSKITRLSNGDFVDLLFEDICGDSTVLTFPITRNYTNDSFANVYDVSYFCELSQSDIDCMREKECVSWRVRFGKQPLMSIVGSNESSWCPKEFAGEVFKAYANHYMELIEELSDEHKIEFTLPNESNASSMADDTCYVYLMQDTSNGYYKIGISNQPEYRERTLQSEKPTIEKICAKAFPNRTIAGAIESALHKAYESKRLRGEWFALDANDVIAIIATLS